MKKLLSFLVIIFLAGFGLGTGQSMPTNQLILLNDETHEYFAPSCLMSEGYNSREAMQIFAREHNLVLLTEERRRILPAKSYPNIQCRDEGAFYEEGRSVTGSFLEWIKLLPKQKQKWSEDGTWNSI